jgi:hypothetical protein
MFRRDRKLTDKLGCKDNINICKKNKKNETRMDSLGGGILVYVKKPYSVFNQKKHEKLEAMTFSIKFAKNNIAFLPVYRTPPHDIGKVIFFDELSKTVNELDSKNDEIIIIGDLNCNMLEKENNKLNEFSNLHGFKHTNLIEGTRTNPTTFEKTLLDIVLCYNIKNFLGKKIFHAPFSDHALVASMFNFRKLHAKKIEFESRVLNPKSILSIKESYRKILPTFIIEHNPANHWQSL